jgi:hypothetical protein
MWVKPQEVLISLPLWQTEKQNDFFAIQSRCVRRRGNGVLLLHAAESFRFPSVGNLAKSVIASLRRGTRGSTSLLGNVFNSVVGTVDNVLDTKALPYRIILRTRNSDVRYVVEISGTRVMY